MQPPFSLLARYGKIRFFVPFLRCGDRVLEVGSGSGWWTNALKKRGYENLITLDIVPPATFVGDVRDWKQLGLTASSFDVIAIFETLEHVDCVRDLWMLLKPGGRLLVTTPVPSGDWFMKICELLRLNQPRVSPHSCLRDISSLPGFRTITYRRILGLTQWGVYERI